MPECVNEFSEYIVIVLLPLILTNILHMLLVKFNGFSNWASPIHSKYFGDNKTWRGFFFVPLVNGFLLTIIIFSRIIIVESPFLLGFYLGLAYVLFELPNSFLKRKLGIKAGEQHSEFRVIFSMLDKMDSAFGVALVYFLLGFVDARLAILFFLFNIFIHAFLSYLLVLLRVKSRF